MTKPKLKGSWGGKIEAQAALGVAKPKVRWGVGVDLRSVRGDSGQVLGGPGGSGVSPPEILKRYSAPEFPRGPPLTPLDLPEPAQSPPGPTPSRPRSSPDLRFCDPKTRLSFDFATPRPPELRFCHPKTLLSFGFVTEVDLILTYRYSINTVSIQYR